MNLVDGPDGGIFVGADARFSDYDGPIDTLIAIGGEGSIGPLAAELLNWLRKRSAKTRRVASVCTGAFILAAAGLLDRRREGRVCRNCLPKRGSEVARSLAAPASLRVGVPPRLDVARLDGITLQFARKAHTIPAARKPV